MTTRRRAIVRGVARWLSPRVLRLMFASGIFGLSVSCLPNNSPTQPGQMGEGKFQYNCHSSEYVCNLDETEPTMPMNFIVGTTFQLSFSANTEGDTRNYRINAVADGFVTESDGGFQANQTGRVAMLAMDLSDNTVMDFIHVAIEKPASLDLFGPGGEEPLTSMKPGDHQTLWAIPKDFAGEILMGDLQVGWKVSNEDVLEPGPFQDTNRPSIEILASKPGQVEVDAYLSDFNVSAALPITVSEVTQ